MTEPDRFPADQKKDILIQDFLLCLKEICIRYGCYPGEVLGPKQDRLGAKRSLVLFCKKQHPELSLHQLGRLMGVDHSTIHNWLRQARKEAGEKVEANENIGD